MKRWHANLLLLIAGAVWGMGFVAQASAMDSIGPYLFIGLRFIVATVVILPFVILEHRRSQGAARVNGAQALPGAALPLSNRDVFKFILIGCSLFMGMATQQVGLLTTSVTNSGFLTGLYVVFTPVLGILLFRTLPHPIIWVAAILALLGIYMLSGGDLRQLVVGDVLTIASAAFWALQVVLIAQFVGDTGRPLALSFVQFVTTAVLALAIAISIEEIEWQAIVAVAPQILYAGMFASGLAFTLQVIGQRYTSAPQAAIFLSSEAPFAALFAYLWLNEKIAVLGLLGCVLILTAMLSVELVPLWMKKKQATTESS